MTFYRDTVSPAQLRIEQLERGDAGRYTCRVDFRISPTVYSGAALEVVAGSSKPVVITAEGVEVMGAVGPYRLGETLILVCMAEGEPAPRVSWLWDGQLWDGEEDPMEGAVGQTRNTLVLSPLERRHAGARLTCQAKNNDVTIAPHTDITLELQVRLQLVVFI